MQEKNKCTITRGYQLFAGQFAKESTDLCLEQAKNTANGITFRIPSLLSVRDKDENEIILAAMDMSESGGDFGRIQVTMRRSLDGGKTFGEMETILSVPVSKAPQKRGDSKSCFVIDPILVQGQSGDVFFIVDMYPECKGLMHKQWLDKTCIYTEVGNKKYLSLYKEKTKLDKSRAKTGKPYTVRENGFVYTPDGKKTNYYLPKNHSSAYAFETAGDLYYAIGKPDYVEACPPLIPEEGEGRDIYCGNIFLSSGKEDFNEEVPKRIQKRIVGPDKSGDEYSNYPCVETKPAPLSAVVRSHLWVLKSSDFGKTWTQPLDISKDVILPSETFLGTGPGVAICLKNQNEKSKNGRIVAPVYSVKRSAVIYSDDNAKTWHRSFCSKNIDETQLAELSDGSILCFGRQKRLSKTPFSISTDGAESWQRLKRTNLSSIKCQKSILVLPKEFYCDKMDKTADYIVACNPSGNYQKNSKRFGGILSLGRVEKDKTITWLTQRRIYTDGINGKWKNFFAYSSLTALKNGNIAVLYEGLPSGLAIYKEFSIDWLFEGEKAFSFPIPIKNRLKKLGNH